MRALVIGFGSIGRRHAANLSSLGHDVSVLRHSRAAKGRGSFPEYHDFDEALAGGTPDFAVVASPTTCHAEHALKLIDRGIPFLLEKPPTLDLASTLAVQAALERKAFTRYAIGFNLRFYPPLRCMKELLARLGHIYAMRVVAGSYLPGWRPGVDYRQTTSARRELGGGVHIDLVHELDYVLWFLGMPREVCAHLAKVSGLEITTQDLCAALLAYPDGAVVELHLDYLSHRSLRGCQVIAERGTLDWTFSEGIVRLTEPGGKPVDLYSLPPGYEFNRTYLDESERFVQVVRGEAEPEVDFSHGVNVMRVLEAIGEASAARRWIAVSA